MAGRAKAQMSVCSVKLSKGSCDVFSAALEKLWGHSPRWVWPRFVFLLQSDFQPQASRQNTDSVPLQCAVCIRTRQNNCPISFFFFFCFSPLFVWLIFFFFSWLAVVVWMLGGSNLAFRFTKNTLNRRAHDRWFPLKTTFSFISLLINLPRRSRVTRVLKRVLGAFLGCF